MFTRRARPLILLAALLLIVVVIAAAVALNTLRNTGGVARIPADDPRLRAENREILFMSNRDGDWDLYAMSLSDKATRNLTPNDADDGFGTYSADGKAISLLSNRDGILDAYMMAADGSDARRVANDLPTIMAVLRNGWINWDLRYAGAGDPLYVSLRDLNLELYIGDRNLTGNGTVDWFPAVSPDGTRIAFASDRDGNQELYLMDSSGENVRRLTDSPGDDLYPAWLDNTRLMFAAERGTPVLDHSAIGLYTLNTAESGLPTVTAFNAAGETVCDRSPQGDARLCMSADAGSWDIYYGTAEGDLIANLTVEAGAQSQDLFPLWRPLQED